ncbi:MAG: L,D-transpeptidase [Tabrizicola sp.]|nr:L,D-transpeptidase [Tabrizicola sp.]
MFAAPLINRRLFITSAIAAAAFPAIAEEAPADWTLPEQYLPTKIRLRDNFEPGLILVDPNTFSLYWTMPKKSAIRYTVGVGRANLYEPGVFSVGAKKEWPSWTPTKEMIARNPAQYARWEKGMPGGPSNPLGARALYLFDDVRGDTFLRIHGTPQPWTIASAVSNGCVRLVNEHIAILFRDAPIGTKVVLYPKKSQA